MALILYAMHESPLRLVRDALTLHAPLAPRSTPVIDTRLCPHGLIVICLSPPVAATLPCNNNSASTFPRSSSVSVMLFERRRRYPVFLLDQRFSSIIDQHEKSGFFIFGLVFSKTLQVTPDYILFKIKSCYVA
ncbi:hypothetical protein L596_002214 [Steinernema carpocapsae]|uniref:Uncharacterized protein n=1 Tax=Steinernema carpocapsae TaxID=34508 RepID=A0A4U8UQJ2_STECR|nr:hypothetical protein L596_002214 [Steinernema carpocapsae]